MALASPGPALVEAVTDPFEPLMPGNIKPEQAEKYAQSLRKGQPNAERIGLTLYRDALEESDGSREVLMEALKENAPDLVSAGMDGTRREEPEQSLSAQRNQAPER